MKLTIYRYNPETGRDPYIQDFELEDGQLNRDMMLLDALLLLKAQDETLGFRRSCGEGVCGSDGMNVNGRNLLACITPLFSLRTPIDIRPMPGLPVIRDLVVDMQQFYRQYRAVDPYLINKDPVPEVERLQSVRLLFHLLSVVLVESGQVPRPGGTAAGLAFPCRQPRPGHRRTTRQPGRTVQAVPLPHHHELRRGVSQGAEPDARHRAHQGTDDPADHLMTACDGTTADYNRLVWQCRRGMRELDELLHGFMVTRYHALDATGQRVFNTLLAYPDSVLLEMLMGRMAPADRDVASLVLEIRHTAAS
jgi:succinate dehydrogenase flavin-adding protein (antitoxin of CptAB toxin-antitoxin module)